MDTLGGYPGHNDLDDIDNDDDGDDDDDNDHAGYDPHTDPSISNVFSTAALRSF